MKQPELTPTPRTGHLQCGRVAPGEPDCDAPAVWHVAWWFTPKADFSLLCEEHMGWAQHEFVYIDRHPAEINCDMPGTGWLLADPSRCVPASTNDIANSETREAHHA
ncbi:hypothetical protein ACIRJS_32865 [Streptomyces sp. NPDC102340]|uniref:hypothetical protein n=1 Tax=unclassified Streptomyces TaxID=2593676 RepID=UPI0037F4BECC